MNDTVELRAKRVLAVGSRISAASGIAADTVALLVVMEQDPVRADEARRRYADLGDRVVIINGDPRRLLYKLAGPFDAIIYDVKYDSMRAALDRLLAPDGVMIPTASQ